MSELCRRARNGLTDLSHLLHTTDGAYLTARCFAARIVHSSCGLQAASSWSVLSMQYNASCIASESSWCYEQWPACTHSKGCNHQGSSNGVSCFAASLPITSSAFPIPLSDALVIFKSIHGLGVGSNSPSAHCRSRLYQYKVRQN